METIPITKFKTSCLSALQKVKKTGQPLLITKSGQPVAMVTTPPGNVASGKAFGCMKQAIKIQGDILKPLPEKDWETLRS
jgi:antitoxin (DNA-binding transcriptional repressor) of toxin-antitoxin stability system